MPVISPKRKPALPPKIEATPNPLAAVNPSPAGNRNSAIPKTGAVLPFPNPNQPQVDLATPKGTLPDVPSVVGGVTAGAVSAPPQRVDYADLWYQAHLRKEISYQQYNDAIYEQNDLSRYVLPPVGGLPPVVGGGTGVQLTPPPAETPPAGPSAETPEEELKRLQRELSALQLAGEDDPDYQVSAGTAARIRAIQDRIEQLFNQLHPSTLPPKPPAGPEEKPPGGGEGGGEEKGPIKPPPGTGPDDPSGYVDKDGNPVSNSALEAMNIAWALANGYIKRPETKGPAGGIMDWIDTLPDWLQNILIPGTSAGRLDPSSLTDAQLKEGLAALAGKENDPSAKPTIQALQNEQTKRTQVKEASEAEAAVKALGLDAYGVTAEEFAKYSPDQFLRLYNSKDSKMTDVQLRGFLETWQKRNPGQKIPVPTDKNSRAYQFYQTMKTVGKADALFAPEAAGPAGAVTSQQMSTYMGVLNRLGVLPRTADDAYNWLSVPLEPPPGLIDTNLGWVNADGSPPTPEQQQALNAYISRLDTQQTDREAAYKLIAARDGQVAANNARQKDYDNDLKLQKQRDERLEEAAKEAETRQETRTKEAETRQEARTKEAETRQEARTKEAEDRAIKAGIEAEKRLESRTISAEQRAEATRIAAEGRAATAKIVEEMRFDARVTISEDRAIKAGIEAEQRLESRTISAEQRAEATQIAEEGRAAAARIVDESRAIKAGIEAEQRLESRTISAEQRAEATRIAAEGRAISEGKAAEQRLESRTISAEQRAEATRIAAEGRAISAGIAAEGRLESRTISAEQRAEASRVAEEGRAAAARIKARASGGAPAGAEATANYRTSLRGFTTVPTTLAEAKGWLGQTLPAPPGLTYDATTNQWVDESGNLPTGDRAQAVQDYEFQQSQYGKNRERADAIVKSYADLDAVQRGRDAAEAALQRALGTKDVLEQVELTYLLDKAELDLKETQRKSQMVQAYVALTNNPSTAARMKSLGLLDQFNRDTGMNVTVPDKVSKDKVFALLPSLGDWANMNPQQQMDALEMLSARTGWMPEELAALMSEVAGAPGGFRGGGVSSSTVARSR